MTTFNSKFNLGQTVKFDSTIAGQIVTGKIVGYQSMIGYPDEYRVSYGPFTFEKRKYIGGNEWVEEERLKIV